jgi:DNA-binding response OmpR family regulator
MARILVVEDHAAIAEGLAVFLQQDGHQVQIRPDGSDLEALAASFDLFVLDVMLPGRDGFALAQVLRPLTRAPFLFLTAKGEEADRLAGWDLGASDYVVKPFSAPEVVRRVRAILGRMNPFAARGFGLGEHRLVLEAESHRAFLDAREVALTPGEWSLLRLFLERPQAILTRKALMSEALSYYVDTGERAVDTHVKNLRAKLDELPWIETVRGFGYRFAGEAVRP